MHFFIMFIRKTALSALGNDAFKAIVLFAALLWYATAGFLYFELPQKPDLGWGDALWWTLVTMATVGYGDLFPTTAGGRYLVGLPTMVFGIGFLGFIITSVASQLIETRSRRLQGMLQTRLADHIIIVNFTQQEEILALVRELRSDESTGKKEICLIDERLPQIPPQFVDLGVSFVKGNPTDEDVLRRACLDTASHAIILSRDRHDPHADDQNLVTVMVIEKIHPAVFSVVEVIDPRKTHQFELAGADSAVCVNEFAVNLIIQELQDPGVKAVVDDLTSNTEGEQLYIVPIERMKDWRYRELAAWGQERRTLVIGLMTDGRPRLNCAPDELVRDTDRAIVIASVRPQNIRTAG